MHQETIQKTGGGHQLGPYEDKTILIVIGVLSDLQFFIGDDPNTNSIRAACQKPLKVV